jgi:phosphatidylserine/phosphatidylglycerophosphate/cardiolipin synthase-like enzyme
LVLAGCSNNIYYDDAFTPPDNADLAMGGGSHDLSHAGSHDMAGQPPPPSLTFTSNVQLYVEPDDGLTPITNAIKGAQKSIYIEMYLFTDSTVMSQLSSAKRRGIDVRVILEQHPNMATSSATSAYSQLQNAGISVQWSNSTYKYTHQKSMIIDGKTLYAMTMNFTGAAAYSNREYVVVDTDPADVAEAEAVFNADWSLTTTPAVKRLVVSPVTSRNLIASLILSAQSEVDIEWEELSDGFIQSDIINRLQKGVKVKIICPETAKRNTTNDTATAGTLAFLQMQGADVRILSSPSVHAKMILVDRKNAFVGSENATHTSLDLNREMGVLWNDPTAIQRAASTFDGDHSAASPF